MASYEMVRLTTYGTSGSSQFGFITATSPSILQWAENELRQRYPGARVRMRAFDIFVEKVNVQEACWELMTQLLHQGWEPFAVDQQVCWLRRQS